MTIEFEREEKINGEIHVIYGYMVTQPITENDIKQAMEFAKVCKKLLEKNNRP